MADLPPNPLMDLPNRLHIKDGAGGPTPDLASNPLMDSGSDDLPANPLLEDASPNPKGIFDVSDEGDQVSLDHVVACPRAIRLCDNKGCSKPGDENKRCGKCFISCYCTKACQVEDWKRHKRQCKANRTFVLSSTTEEHLMCLSLDFVKHFRDNFAGSDEGYRRYKEHFDKLETFGVEKGR